MQPLFHKLVIRSTFFTIFFTSLFLAGLVGYLGWLDYNPYKDRSYPGVYLGNHAVGHLTSAEVRSIIKTLNRDLSRVKIEIAYSDTEIATFSGTTLSLGMDETATEKSIMNVAREQNLLTRSLSKVRHTLLHQKTHIPMSAQYSLTPIEEYLSYLNDTYAFPPQDARFELTNGKVSVFQIEKSGQKIDSEDTVTQVTKFIESEISESATSSALIIKTQIVEDAPSIQIADINTMGIVEKIGEGISDYTHSAPERIHNLSLAASRIHGVLVPPGEIFSYNKAVGDISAKTGYKQGYVIQNGHTVLGDGGGVCQVSTTLFRAALNTGLPIVQRKAHSYRVRYYENDQKPGLDATAFAPSVDFKFKNDTGNYILIQTINDTKADLLHMEFYGTRDGRVATLSPIKVWSVQPAPEPSYVDDPTLPRGTTKQIDWAATGAKSSFTYTVTRNGEELQNRVFNSVYRPWQAVFLVGTM